jgi:copper chaperone CopZ
MSSTMPVTSSFVVSGMTCDHCVHAVTEEVSAIGGVHDVRVDLGTGQLVVISETDIPYAAVAAAVDEAGYSLTAR